MEGEITASGMTIETGEFGLMNKWPMEILEFAGPQAIQTKDFVSILRYRLDFEPQ
jgi:hypothetical protein